MECYQNLLYYISVIKKKSEKQETVDCDEKSATSSPIFPPNPNSSIPLSFYPFIHSPPISIVHPSSTLVKNSAEVLSNNPHSSPSISFPPLHSNVGNPHLNFPHKISPYCPRSLSPAGENLEDVETLLQYIHIITLQCVQPVSCMSKISLKLPDVLSHHYCILSVRTLLDRTLHIVSLKFAMTCLKMREQLTLAGAIEL